MSSNEMITHKAAVRRMALWLRNSRGCSVVATERSVTAVSEQPDVIGWHSNNLKPLIVHTDGRINEQAVCSKMPMVEPTIAGGAYSASQTVAVTRTATAAFTLHSRTRPQPNMLISALNKLIPLTIHIEPQAKMFMRQDKESGIKRTWEVGDGYWQVYHGEGSVRITCTSQAAGVVRPSVQRRP